jgi:hypothetical protein
VEWRDSAEGNEVSQKTAKIIEPYIAKLEQLRDLADPQHRVFLIT